MTFVFVSKFYQYSQILLQFSVLAYPQIEIEVSDRAANIKTKNPYRVIAILEDDKDDCLRLMQKYPGKLRFVSRNFLLTDFDRLLLEEGIQRE